VPSKTYIYSFLVAFADTDCGEVVYYSRYLEHSERARTQLFVELGLSQCKLKHEHSIGFMVKSCQADYRLSAKFEDLVTVKTSIEASKSRLEFNHKFFNDEGSLLFDNNVTMVCINTDSLRPVKIPNFIGDLLCV